MTTILQQILSDMYIDPELLAELSEEQKQILFVKMREEQVRRYYAKEAELDRENKPKVQPNNKKSKDKKVDFLKGSDGKEWVWVMGEHKEDLSIEEILERETKEKARIQAEKEAEELRKKEEEEAKQQSASINSKSKSINHENKSKFDSNVKSDIPDKKQFTFIQKNSETAPSNQAKASNVRIRRHRDQFNRDVIDRRSREIVESFRELRARFEQKALEEKDQIESNWRLAEQRAKKEEEAQRQRARLAREEYRKSLLIECEDTLKSDSKPIPSRINPNNGRPSVSPRPVNLPSVSQIVMSNVRTTRPQNKLEVMEWFKKIEEKRRAHIDPVSGNIPVWFHGLISREAAEQLLQGKPPHSFLVRVSERIFGYAVSYKGSEEGVTKHFMIEVLPDTGKYRFFGTTTESFNTLSTMILHYKTHPVSVNEEYLLHSVGQNGYPPDYANLLSYISEEDCSTDL